MNLTKPSEDEFYDINVQNENMNIIDREIGGLKQPTYEVSTAMSDLNSGEMITVAFGKIAKAVSTLISHVASKATSSVLGHVKLSDSTSSTSASTAGVAATPKAVKAAYDLANSNTKKIGTTDISGIGDGTVTGAIVNNKEAIEDVSQSLTAENGTKFRFGQNSEGKYGYIVNKDGADTVIPFKNGECKLLGRYSGNKTISLESLGYPNATKDNFLVLIDSIPSPNKMEYFINFQNNYYTQFGVTAQSPSWAVNGTNLVVAGMYINGYLKNTYEQNNINLVTSTSAYSWRLYYIS